MPLSKSFPQLALTLDLKILLSRIPYNFLCSYVHCIIAIAPSWLANPASALPIKFVSGFFVISECTPFLSASAISEGGYLFLWFLPLLSHRVKRSTLAISTPQHSLRELSVSSTAFFLPLPASALLLRCLLSSSLSAAPVLIYYLFSPSRQLCHASGFSSLALARSAGRFLSTRLSLSFLYTHTLTPPSCVYGPSGRVLLLCCCWLILS